MILFERKNKGAAYVEFIVRATYPPAALKSGIWGSVMLECVVRPNGSVGRVKVVKSLDTTITGVQTALTLYSLVMAAFMITGSKLADIWGRKRTFVLGVIVYGTGALVTARR